MNIKDLDRELKIAEYDEMAKELKELKAAHSAVKNDLLMTKATGRALETLTAESRKQKRSEIGIYRTPKQLGNEFNIGPNTIKHHLEKLRDDGAIVGKRPRSDGTINPNSNWRLTVPEANIVRAYLKALKND